MNKELAEFIIEWLQTRNGGKLKESFDNMTVRDYNLMHEELERILDAGGKPRWWI